MKKLKLALALILPLAIMAQDKEGTINYEEVVKFEFDLPEDMQQYADQLPTEQKTNMILTFTPEESLYKLGDKADLLPEENEDDLVIKVETVIMGGGGSSVIYTDLKNKTALQAMDMMGKKFLITLDTDNKKWQAQDEQRDILGYTCMKAVMKEDAQTVTAWFTPQIPLGIGPDSYSGLAGAILAVEIQDEDGIITISATSVELGALKQLIKAPTKGEKMTEAKFEKMMAERMATMQEMHGGEGNIMIRRDIETD